MSPVPPPLPLSAAWPSLGAPVWEPLTPAYFQLETAVFRLQDLEASRSKMAELCGILEAYQNAFEAVHPRKAMPDPLPPNPRAEELGGKMVDAMRQLGVVRDQAFDKAQTAFEALSYLPDLIRQEDLLAIGSALRADDPMPAFGRMTSYLVPLQGALARRRVEAERDLRSKLDLLQQMTSGLRPVAGLPAARFARGRLLPEAVPEWARDFTVRVHSDALRTEGMTARLDRTGSFYVGFTEKPGVLSFEEIDPRRQHVEIFFDHGGYWICDVGNPSHGVTVDGRRLKPGLPETVAGEARVRIGADDFCGFSMRLPEPPLLESLRLEIAGAESVREIADLLRSRYDPARFPAEAQLLAKLEKFLDDGTPLRTVPTDGGLRARLQELLLEERYRELRSRYVPEATDWVSQKRLEDLARQVAAAETPQALVAALRSSRLPGVPEIAPVVEGFFSSKPSKNFSVLPEAFGIRSQVESLVVADRVSPEEIEDLRRLKVDPILMIERPWTSLKPSRRWQEELQRLRTWAGDKLDLQSLRKTVEEEMTWDPGYLREVPDGAAIGENPGEVVVRHWVYGGQWEGTSYNARLALAVKEKYARPMRRLLSQIVSEMAADGLPFQYRMTAVAEGFAHAGPVVVFFQAKDQETVLARVSSLVGGHPLFFGDGRPLFAFEVRGQDGETQPGLSFGEEPSDSPLSFLELRLGAVLEAIEFATLLTRRREPVSWQKLLQLVLFFGERAGISGEEPAVETRGVRRYETILK